MLTKHSAGQGAEAVQSVSPRKRKLAVINRSLILIQMLTVRLGSCRRITQASPPSRFDGHFLL